MNEYELMDFIRLLDRCKCDLCQNEKRRVENKLEARKQEEEKRKQEIRDIYK